MNGVSYDVPWMRKDRWLVEATPGLCPPCHSLTLTPPRPMYIQLSITYVTLVSHCSVRDVDEAFSESGSYTIFEVDRRLRQVFLEFGTLLDHLLRHINMPAHVAKRGLLPFVTSNPSASYIQSVVDASQRGVRWQNGFWQLRQSRSNGKSVAP